MLTGRGRLVERAIVLIESIKMVEEARRKGPSGGSWFRPGAFPGKRIPGGGTFVRSLRGGKKRLKPKCPPGKIFKNGRCMRVSGMEKIKLMRAARKRKIKLKRKIAQAKFKRFRTMRKRKALGLKR